MIGSVVKDGLGAPRQLALTVIALTALMFGLVPALHAASVPVLMILEHNEAGKKVVTKIETKGGLVASPNKGKPREKWIIRPGDILASAARPGERIVNFYQGSGIQRILLFIVKVRYFPDSEDKWAPRFQLNEEPLVVRGPDGRWKPFTTIQGVPNLIVQSGFVLPNAEGYSAALELGFTTGATSIDAWVVQ